METIKDLSFIVSSLVSSISLAVAAYHLVTGDTHKATLYFAISAAFGVRL